MTHTTHAIAFGPFRLDLQEVRLWKGDTPVALQPRPLAVLSYLAARPGAVVKRDELLATLWGDTVVTKAVLKVAVRAVREALEDPLDAPRYIETVGRTGYRFIGAGAHLQPSTATAPDGVAMIGRQAELALLWRSLAGAQAGTRKLLLVSGETGVGKTTLLDRFVEQAAHEPDVWIARGQCLDQYGEGEAYLPLLDALGRAARDASARAFGQVLRKHAPSWASQLPALAPRRGDDAMRDAANTPQPTRMLREMADALEVFTKRHTLVLVLEDLQWSDRSTVELLEGLARRRQAARLFVIGSMRPTETIVSQHPLRLVQQELQASGQCEVLTLELLSAAEVAAYVEARFGNAPAAAQRQLARHIHRRTEGNALFMVNMANDLVARGLLAWRDDAWHVDGSIAAATDEVPVGLQALIGSRIRALSAAARRTLEVASVAGSEFAVATVAAALGVESGAVETECEGLAAQGLMIAAAGVREWPDGTVTARYRFLHALYRHVLYDGIGEARRIRLHRDIGRREEAGFAAQASGHAAQLAMHFARGHDRARALHYHEAAAHAALGRHAMHEAATHFGAALEALADTAGAPQLRQHQLQLAAARATLLMATHGYAAVETEREFARARALCAALPDSPIQYPVLRGLLSYHHVRGELTDAHQLGERLLGHAERAPTDTALRVQAHYGHGATLFHVGALPEAAIQLRAGLEHYTPSQHATHANTYGGYDPGVACALWLAWTLAFQGHLAEAATHDRNGLALARQLPDPFSLAWGCHGAGVTQQLFGNWAASEALSAEAAQLADEHGFPHVFGMATVNRGWATTLQGNAAAGVPMLREGIAAVEATGASLMRPSYLGMLAAVDVLQGDRAAALRRFDDGLAVAECSGEHLHLPALLIGKSHLLAGGGPGGRAPRAMLVEAEKCLHRAIELAQAQQARLVQLRAALALARHCRKQDREAEGRAHLAAAYAWFAEMPASAPEIVAARKWLTA